MIRRLIRCVFAFSILLTVAASVAEEIRPADDAPQPLTPAKSKAKIRLPDGFRIELVACEPVVQEPSCIAFDERGRLFVCELHGYNVEGEIDVAELNKSGELDKQVRRIRWELQGGEIADAAAKRQFGVVKMLVDTDGDGVMDKAEVWADDLPPCYGVVAARGGIIVVCAPDIVFLADRDGDGKPEVRETLLTGFGADLLERGINNPRWGFDNWIYVGASNQGGRITGPNLSQPVDLPHSDFRIKPDGSAIEAVNGRVGTFGLTINHVGDRFPSTGGQPAMYALPLPYRYLARNPHVATPSTNHQAADYNRGFRISDPHPWRVRRREDPAWIKFYGDRETNSNYFSGGCSNEFYGDTLFPQQYRGCIFYCEPSLNIIHRCDVQRHGAGYRGARVESEQESEFLASTDQWFRPMNLRVGPEGALYIVDMYREIIEDYSAIPRFLQQQYGLDKGRRHGRIWRLLPKDSDPDVDANMAKLTNPQLAVAIADSQAWRRLTAQRLLIERRAKSITPVLKLHIQATENPRAKIHALYTLEGLGRLEIAEIRRAIHDDDFGVRVHGLRLCEPWLDKDAKLLQRVVAMADDVDPSVRIQVALTLGEAKNVIAAEGLLRLAENHGDERWMTSAIVSSAGDKSGPLLAALLQSNSPGKQTLGLLRPLCATLAGENDAQGMSRILTEIAESEPAYQIECLNGFLDVLIDRDPKALKSDDGWAPLTRLLQSDSPAVRDLATKLAVPLRPANSKQLDAIFDAAVSRSLDERIATGERRRAVHVLASAPLEKLLRVAEELLDASEPAELQIATIESLGTSNDPRAAELMLKRWKSYTPIVRKSVMQAMFARSNRFAVLLDSMERKIVRASELTAGQREQLMSSADADVALRAKELLANPSADAQLQQRIDTYQKALAGTRSADRGKGIFRQHCLACHQVGNEGFAVGPKLGSVINRPDETILLDLLDPSGRIEPEYRSYMVATKDGRTFAGLLASESPTSITLQNQKNETEDVLRKDIDVFKASEVSLMPSNLHEQISPQGVADLIEYMRDAFTAKR